MESYGSQYKEPEHKTVNTSLLSVEKSGSCETKMKGM